MINMASQRATKVRPETPPSRPQEPLEFQIAESKYCWRNFLFQLRIVLIRLQGSLPGLDGAIPIAEPLVQLGAAAAHVGGDDAGVGRGPG